MERYDLDVINSIFENPLSEPVLIERYGLSPEEVESIVGNAGLVRCPQCGLLVPPEDVFDGYYCRFCHTEQEE